MSEINEKRTLVLVALPVAQTPVAPHRPGTYVIGYLTGEQQEAHEYLNACKAERSNVVVQNAFLMQVGIEFRPEVDPQQPGQQVKTGIMGITQGFALMPLTNMDAVNGCDYGVDAQHWIFPKGSMIQDMEAQMQVAADQLLHARTGMTRHLQTPAGMAVPKPTPRA